MVLHKSYLGWQTKQGSKTNVISPTRWEEKRQFKVFVVTSIPWQFCSSLATQIQVLQPQFNGDPARNVWQTGSTCKISNNSVKPLQQYSCNRKCLKLQSSFCIFKIKKGIPLSCSFALIEILCHHRVEGLHEVALHLRELSVLLPFRVSRIHFMF